MKLFKSSPKKNSAQAIVEFAIALPILLMLLYGILETGRLMFLYSTVVTASRQAARYGSSTGAGTNGAPRYQDCAGIKAAAQKADYLNAFDDADIVITYDDGPGTAGANPPTNPPTVPPWKDICNGTVDTGVNPSKNNISRIYVEIKADFMPLVPKLVPFIKRTVANGNPIKAGTYRTIVVSVSIEVTAPPTLGGATSTRTRTPTRTPTDTLTPTITRTPTQTRTPTPTVTGTPPTATPSRTPTITYTPSNTYTPTATGTPTFTASPTGTALASCTITHGPLSISGNTMSMTITNLTNVSISIADIFVSWNNSTGHTGTNKTLRLQQGTLNGVFYTNTGGGLFAPSLTIDSSINDLPNGTSTIYFTFNQSYDNPSGSERIFINLSTNGCTNSPIDSSN